MIEKAKQANRYGMNFKLATAAKIREMLLSDEFLDALAKRISYKSGIWIPKVGDRVRVNRPGRLSDGKIGVIVEGDAGEYTVRISGHNLTSRNLTADDLEPIEAAPAADHIADANKKVPGDLLVDTTIKFNDGSRTVPSLEIWNLAVQGHPDHVEGVWVEEAAKDPETTARYDSDGRDVTELAGLWTDGDTQYREPTYADLANGPIEVEVCDDTNCDLNWEKRQLYAILPQQIIFRYICQNPFMKGSVESWKHARVKVR